MPYYLPRGVVLPFWLREHHWLPGWLLLPERVGKLRVLPQFVLLHGRVGVLHRVPDRALLRHRRGGRHLVRCGQVLGGRGIRVHELRGRGLPDQHGGDGVFVVSGW